MLLAHIFVVVGRIRELILVVIAVTIGKQISIDFVVVHISKGTGVIKILDANDLSHLAPLGD